MKNQELQWLLEEKYSGEKSAAFFADVKRLALGEPLAYLIGWTPFLDNKIYLDSRPLIPRPETESWTEEAIKTIRGSATLPLGFESKPLRILDLCAGSGCIGVAVARAIPDALVDFAEIDTNHLTTIKKNLVENNIDDGRTSIIHSNLFSNLSHQYDFILANPPYLDADLNRVDSSVKNSEPYIALFGGHKGMEVIAPLIIQAPQYLSSGGQLWLEHEPEQSAAIGKLAEGAGFSITTHRDQYNVERYSILVLQ